MVPSLGPVLAFLNLRHHLYNGPGGDRRHHPGNQALCYPSLSRRWSGGSGWDRSQQPGKPSLRGPTTLQGQTSTTHCRYLVGYWKEVEAYRLGALCPIAVFSPQNVALTPEFLAAVEYSTSPGADLEGLLQQLETVSGEGLAPSPDKTMGCETGPSTHYVCLQKPNQQELEGPLGFTYQVQDMNFHSLSPNAVLQGPGSDMSQLGVWGCGGVGSSSYL